MNSYNLKSSQQLPATISWSRAVLAGLIGTAFLDLSGFVLTGQWWDTPELLSSKLEVPFIAGLAAHFGNGVAIAIIYAALAPSLFGPKWFRATSFITVQTILGVWLFMLPLLGAGFAGLNANTLLPVISLLRHLAYAIPLILLIPVAIPRVEKRDLDTKSREAILPRRLTAPSLF